MWDDFCQKAGNATFLHTRKFLGYHGTRFRDESILILRDNGTIVAALPAAIDPLDIGTVVSHPGATYGGLIHQGWLTGSRMVEAFYYLKRHYASLGFKRFVYKALPYIYSLTPAQDDLYAMFRNGANLVRCDLSCTIDLSYRRPPSDRRRRNLKKALRSVNVSSDPTLIGALWLVISDNLAREHQTTPVHSLEELSKLLSLFPNNIKVLCAEIEHQVVAGIVLFNSSSVWHAQYIASSEKGYQVSALDAIFEKAIELATSERMRYFDFGISNEDNGRTLNDGLHRFKSEFGGSGVVHEFYEMDLT